MIASPQNSLGIEVDKRENEQFRQYTYVFFQQHHFAQEYLYMKFGEWFHLRQATDKIY